MRVRAWSSFIRNIAMGVKSDRLDDANGMIYQQKGQTTDG